MKKQLEKKGKIELTPSKEFEQAEWCFQFFENEPVVFAFSQADDNPGSLVLEIKPTEDEGLTFVKDGMQFKIFAREITEVGLKMREEQQSAS
jgi:hypothetical protein